MSMQPGHPAKDWWGQATEGERVYNLPAAVSPFTVPRPGSGVRGLGAADSDQVQLLALLDTQVWAELTAAQDMLQQVAKYDPQLEQDLARELQAFFVVANNLEGNINQAKLPMSEADRTELEGDIIVLSSDVRDFKVRVNRALREGVEGGNLRTALVGAAVGAAAIGIGWYVFRRSTRKGRR